MTATTSEEGLRLYGVLLTDDDETPGTWLTVAADNVIEAMQHAVREPWWGDETPEWATRARVAAVECLGKAWH